MKGKSKKTPFVSFLLFSLSSLKFQLSPRTLQSVTKFVYFFNQSDSFLKSDFTSSIVPRNISAIWQKFCTFFPLYYLFFKIFLSEYCSLVVKVSFVLHSQKRHRLAASCEFYPLAASCQQVAASLLTSSSCSKSVKSDLLQLDICRLAASCCNNLQQACGQQVLTSLIEQLAASLLNASMLMQAAKIRLVAT